MGKKIWMFFDLFLGDFGSSVDSLAMLCMNSNLFFLTILISNYHEREI